MKLRKELLKSKLARKPTANSAPATGLDLSTVRHTTLAPRWMCEAERRAQWSHEVFEAHLRLMGGSKTYRVAFWDDHVAAKKMIERCLAAGRAYGFRGG